MRISSGGTRGPRLADELAELDNNVYGTVSTSKPAKKIAESFAAAGWQVRASSWENYEVEQEWASLELRPTPEAVIFSGVVDPARLDDLGAVFTSFDLSSSIELYDQIGTNLIRELRT